MSSSDSKAWIERNGSFGPRVLISTWTVLAVAIYLFGLVRHWAFWGMLGVAFAPLFAAMLLLPAAFALQVLEAWAARITVAIYLVIHLSLLVITGWWADKDAGLEIWPMLLPLGSSVATMLLLAPVALVYSLWSGWRPDGQRGGGRRPGGRILGDQTTATKSDGSSRFKMDGAAKIAHQEVLRWVGFVAAVLTIIAFIVEFLI